MKLARKLMLAMIVGICLIFGLFAYFRIEREYALFEKDIKRDHLTLGHALSVAVKRIGRKEGEAKALDLVKNANTQYSNLNLRWVWLEAVPGTEFAPKADRAKLVSLKEGKEVSWVDHSAKGDFILTYVPVSLKKGRVGALEIVESMDEQQAYVSKSVVRILWTTVGMIAVAVLLSSALGYLAVGRPMNQLVEMAQQIGSGDFSAALRLKQRDEIGQLADEMNRMAEQLRSGREKFARSISLLESILADAPVGRAFVDRELRVGFINDMLVRLSGRPVGEHLGKPLGEFFPMLAPGLEMQVRQVLASGRSAVNVEISHFECTFYPVRAPSGEIQGIGLIVDDVSERKQIATTKKRFLEYVVSAQEEERRRLARELHDGVGQILSALSMQSQTVAGDIASEEGRAKVEEMRSRILEALDEIGRMVRGLHPILLDELGLIQAIDRLRKDFREAYGIHVDMKVLGFDSVPRLPSAIESTLYRIVQEALSNVARHSQASSANILIQRLPDRVQTTIEDNGHGFEVGRGEEGIGLMSMRERADLLNGTFEIESGAGKGTTVYVRIPYSEVA